MATIIRPKKWEDFQHYKDRSPPWIKLHRTLLDNYEFHTLQLASRALAPCYWLLASEGKDGCIDVNPEKLAWRLRVDGKTIVETVKELIHKGFFDLLQDDSGMLATCYQRAMPETETEGEKETEAEQRERARRETGDVSKKPKKQKREATGTRLPDDWELTDEQITFAQGINPAWTTGHILTIGDSFRDYWLSVPGGKGRKTDWHATWRNWVRREAGRSAPFAGPPSKLGAVMSFKQREKAEQEAFWAEQERLAILKDQGMSDGEQGDFIEGELANG